MKTKRKIISLLLCFSLLISCMFPFSMAAFDSDDVIYTKTFTLENIEYTLQGYGDGAFSLTTGSGNDMSCLTVDAQGNGIAEITTDGNTQFLNVDIDDLTPDDVDVTIYDNSTTSQNTAPISITTYHINSPEELYNLSHSPTQTCSVVAISVWSISQLIYVIVSVLITLVVAGVTYHAIASVVEAIQKDRIKARQCYRAYYKSGLTDVYIDYSNPISATESVARVKSGLSFYTFNRTNAYNNVVAAGLGVIGPEIDKNLKSSYLYYYHYHTANRNGAHAWYGLPVTA